MTDKVQKIREEVERLQNELIQEKEKGFGSDTDDACILELQNVLTYIDSLQEEPLIVDAPPYDYVKGFSDGRLYEKRQKEELVSEDLEAEIERINKNNYFDFSDWKAIARHFANWQKEQNKETIELAEDHAMLAGIIKGTEHTIGEVRSILNKVAYKNNGLDVNGDYYEQPYIELDNEFRKLLK